MNAGACRIWIEDSNHNRIAGDGKGDYNPCNGFGGDSKDIYFSNQEYNVVAKVEFSLRKRKVRMTIPVFVYMKILQSFILINITSI
ncbi:unnamed protein product [Rhizophagus irregularis]|nr:unnamed protein product [Rhizophagus irregularis]